MPGFLAIGADLHHVRIFEVLLCDDFWNLGSPCRTHFSANSVQVGRVGVLEEDKYPAFKGKRGDIHAAFEL